MIINVNGHVNREPRSLARWARGVNFENFPLK